MQVLYVKELGISSWNKTKSDMDHGGALTYIFLVTSRYLFIQLFGELLHQLHDQGFRILRALTTGTGFFPVSKKIWINKIRKQLTDSKRSKVTLHETNRGLVFTKLEIIKNNQQLGVENLLNNENCLLVYHAEEAESIDNMEWDLFGDFPEKISIANFLSNFPNSGLVSLIGGEHEPWAIQVHCNHDLMKLIKPMNIQFVLTTRSEFMEFWRDDQSHR